MSERGAKPAPRVVTLRGAVQFLRDVGHLAAASALAAVISEADQERGTQANPFLEGKRSEAEREALRLTIAIAELTHEDPVEVFAAAAHYEGAQRQKVNPAAMSDDRLLNTLIDLRATLKNVQAKARREAP